MPNKNFNQDAEDFNTYLITKVAQMYYIEGFDQRAISKRLDISISKVSRLLAEARRNGTVTITVNDTRDGRSNLEQQIERTYGVSECLVARSYASKKRRFEELGRLTTGFLNRILGQNEYVGVSWGETLKGVADNIAVDPSRRIQVVPIIGAMGEFETGVYPNRIAASIALNSEGKNRLVNTPFIVSSPEIRQQLEYDDSYLAITETWKQVSCAIISTGDVSQSSSLRRYGILSNADLRVLSDERVDYTANGCFFSAHGVRIHTSIEKRMIRMDLDQLKNVPHVVLCAAGAQKLGAVRAATRGGFANILVIDEEIAQGLVRESPPS